mgnify:CR=1 FL=1
MDITLMSSIAESVMSPRQLLNNSLKYVQESVWVHQLLHVKEWILAKHTNSNSLLWQMKFTDLKARRETYQKQAKLKKLRQVLKSTKMLQ